MPVPKPPTRRAGTKQAMLITMLQAPTGATMEEIISATGWQAHSARGAMSGALGKKLGLIVPILSLNQRALLLSVVILVVGLLIWEAAIPAQHDQRLLAPAIQCLKRFGKAAADNVVEIFQQNRIRGGRRRRGFTYTGIV